MVVGGAREVLNKRADTDSPKHNGPHVGPHVMHPLCDIIQAHALLCMRESKFTWYWTSLMGGGRAGSTLAGLDQNCKNLHLAPRVPGVVAGQDVQLAHLRPRSRPREKETTLGEDCRGPLLAGHAFQSQWRAGGMERLLTTPVREGEPVPRPRKGNPLGGPVRGIFISSSSDWPASAAVESRESGVEELEVGGVNRGGVWLERIIVIRGRVAL